MTPYIRQSRAKEQTISLDDQRRQIAAWAASHPDVPLGPEVVEQNVSGKTPWRERELGVAIRACESGKAGGVIVAYQDRLSRENLLATAEVWEALDKAGARFVACDGVDSAAEGSEFLFNIKAAVARENWKRIKKYNDGGRRAMVERGVHGGDKAPRGYSWTRDGKLRGPLVPNADAAKVVAAFEAKVDGKPWSEIIALLGVRSAGAARNILSNRVYTGQARSGEYVREGAHPAIVSEALFRLVQQRLTKIPAHRVIGRDDSLLARVLRCALCGWALTLDRSIRSYRCKNFICTGKACIAAKPTEGYVFQRALAWHATLNPMYEVEQEEFLPVLAENLARALAERDEVEADETLSPLRRAQALTALDAKVQVAEALLAEAEAGRGWLGLDTDAVQRRLLADGPVPVVNGVPHPVCKDVAAGRDFIRQFVRVTVKPCGRGRKLPVAERVEVEYLTPAAVVQPERGEVTEVAR